MFVPLDCDSCIIIIDLLILIFEFSHFCFIFKKEILFSVFISPST